MVQRGGQEEVRVKADGGDVGGQLPLLQIQPESRYHICFKRQVLDSVVADPGCLSRIPDPKKFYPGSRIRIRIKEFKYFYPKKFFLSSRKYHSGCSSRIQILIFYPSRIPDPGVPKAPDPGSGSVTLLDSKLLLPAEIFNLERPSVPSSTADLKRICI